MDKNKPKITKEEETQLLELLKKWFSGADFDKPHYLERNKIAKLIKKELSYRNRWQNKAAPSRANHLKPFRF